MSTPNTPNAYASHNVVQTRQTYATYANARRALERVLASVGASGTVPYLIAATPDGRYAPVLVGQRFIQFAHHGVTVVG